MLIDAMKTNMNSNKLVSILEKDDAEYWKMLKGVEPTTELIQSLDEVLCNQGIKCLMKTLLKDELKRSVSDLDEDLKRTMFKSAKFPAEIAVMFAEH